jgi:putative transposase
MIGLPKEEDAAMEKTGRRKGQEQGTPGQLKLPLREQVREALFETVIVFGLEYVGEVLEEERTALCGPRYQHDPQRQALRAGSMPSFAQLGRPAGGSRAASGRSVDGRELSLPSWRAVECARSAGAAGDGADVGGSRRYARSLEPLPSIRYAASARARSVSGWWSVPHAGSPR